MARLVLGELNSRISRFILGEGYNIKVDRRSVQKLINFRDIFYIFTFNKDFQSKVIRVGVEQGLTQDQTFSMELCLFKG